MVRVPEGFRIRKIRKQQKLTQTELARKAGISVSYLNLIEHNKRPIGGGLLNKIAQILAADPGELSGYDDALLIQDLINLSGTPLLRNFTLEENGAQNIVGREPGWGRAILHLHASYNEAVKTIESLSDRFNRDPFLVESSHEILTKITAIRSFSEILVEIGNLPEETRQRYTSLVADESAVLSSATRGFFAFMDEVDTTVRATTPEGEVEDFIIDHHNYFPMLETAADDLRARVENADEPIHRSLLNYLAERHGLTLKRAEADAESAKAARSTNHMSTRIDYHRVGKHLDLQDWHPPESERFLITQYIFELEYSDLLHEVSTDKRLTSEDARARARRAMARYAAGAVLYPYEPFLEKAKQARYDIQVLQHHFGGSFEQISHRLVTLQRPGSVGVPFFYIRTDLAGNISKRFSLPNLHLPRYGGLCPLWTLYRAFLAAPDQIISQRVQMPDKQEFLFIARAVKKQANTFGEPEKIYSVMLGCDSVYADQLVYSSGNDTAQPGLVTEVGSNCRLCPRPTCAHRAYAPFLPVVH
jgi:hypothetical protein